MQGDWLRGLMIYRASAYGRKKSIWNPQKRGKLTLTEAAGKAALKRALRKRWLTIIIIKTEGCFRKVASLMWFHPDAFTLPW